MKARPRSRPMMPETSSSASLKANILVVEDEQDLQELMQYNLSREGYAVRCVGSGHAALEEVRREKPEVVLLDLMLPGMDGLEVCRKLKADREMAGVGVIMVTAKGEESDIVTGLELGADDYVTKPFNMRVLLARLRAVLRRHRTVEVPEEGSVVRVGRITIDPERYEVKVDQETVGLTHTEFRILQVMARRAGVVFTREQIVNCVQGPNVAVTDRSVDVHIVSLRRKLGDAGVMVQTVRGVGYRLEDE